MTPTGAFRLKLDEVEIEVMKLRPSREKNLGDLWECISPFVKSPLS